MTAREKFIAAALLFSAWFALVLIGKVPAPDFVAGIRDVLIGLGAFHAGSSGRT